MKARDQKKNYRWVYEEKLEETLISKRERTNITTATTKETTLFSSNNYQILLT